MSKKVIQDNWKLVIIPIIAVGAMILYVLGLADALSDLPSSSATATDIPSSESEPPAQVTVDDFKLLGCEEDICIYLVEVPYGDDCILAIQYFIMDEDVFDLECPRP